MKGIVLAGGSGTRLYPLTISTSKQMLPVYDKPMIYYPLSVLMTAGIRDILIISTPTDLPKFEKLLGDGSDLGIKLSYEEQPSPDGLAQAFIIGEKFISGQPCAMILGDNLFYGKNFSIMLKKATKAAIEGTSTIFGFPVEDPQRFGVVEFDPDGTVRSIEEKPKQPKSNLASMGVYIFSYKSLKKYLKEDAKNPDSAHDFGKNIIPAYLKDNLKLQAYRFKGYWKDVGTIDSLWEANMDLLKDNSGLDLFDPDWKIYTDDASATPQCIGSKAKIDNAFITQGAIVNGDVSHSVIFSGATVGEDAKVSESVIMNNVTVGKGAKLTRCLVADDVRIPEGMVLGKKNSDEILLVSKALIAKAGEEHE
jgi:glucose-1-phosphate thymidylyltransferase short form